MSTTPAQDSSTRAITLDANGELSIPILDILTGRGFITGKSGSGKSNSASVIAEELLDRGYPLMIVDTTPTSTSSGRCSGITTMLLPRKLTKTNGKNGGTLHSKFGSQTFATPCRSPSRSNSAGSSLTSRLRPSKFDLRNTTNERRPSQHQGRQDDPRPTTQPETRRRDVGRPADSRGGCSRRPGR